MSRSPLLTSRNHHPLLHPPCMLKTNGRRKSKIGPPDGYSSKAENPQHRCCHYLFDCSLIDTCFLTDTKNALCWSFFSSQDNLFVAETMQAALATFVDIWQQDEVRPSPQCAGLHPSTSYFSPSFANASERSPRRRRDSVKDRYSVLGKSFWSYPGAARSLPQPQPQDLC